MQIKIFETLKQKGYKGIAIVLMLATVFTVMLIIARVVYSGTHAFAFLIWNLFLAWIPFWIVRFYDKFEKKHKSLPYLIVFSGCWLLFLPNAPYIVTDLFHLYPKYPVPLWYDLLLLMTAAWTGLMLGLFSLLNMQRIISRKYSASAGWIFTILSIIASAFGVYIGRFLRWNSWDIITAPKAILKDIALIFLHPGQNHGTYILVAVLSVFLLFSYLVINLIINNKEFSN